MIYIWKDGNEARVFANREYARQFMGDKEPDLELTNAEFGAAGEKARVIGGKILIGLTKAEKIRERQEEIRNIRNRKLKEEVDPVQGVLYWESLSEEKRQEWREYRLRLLDIPQSEEFKTEPASVRFPEKPR